MDIEMGDAQLLQFDEMSLRQRLQSITAPVGHRLPELFVPGQPVQGHLHEPAVFIEQAVKQIPDHMVLVVEHLLVSMAQKGPRSQGEQEQKHQKGHHQGEENPAANRFDRMKKRAFRHLDLLTRVCGRLGPFPFFLPEKGPKMKSSNFSCWSLPRLAGCEAVGATPAP